MASEQMEWVWMPHRTNLSALAHQSEATDRLPTEPFYTHWVKLGLFCSMYDNDFRVRFLGAFPVRHLKDTWYQYLYEALSAVPADGVDYVELFCDHYLKRHHPDKVNAVKLVEILDIRDFYWINIEEAKTYVKNQLKNLSIYI